jgi:hypothetical protein
MISAIKSELYKTLHEKIFFILILWSVGLALLSTWLNIKLGNLSYYPNDASEIFLKSTNNFSLIIIIDAIFLELTIGRDFTDKTIQSTLLKGSTRVHVFGSKVIISFLLSAVLSIVFPVAFTISMSFTKGVGSFTSMAEIGPSLAVYYFIQNAVIFTCIYVCFLLKGARTSFFINGICIGIGSEILFNQSKKISLVHKILRWTPIGYLDILNANNLKLLVGIKIISISLTWIILFGLLTGAVFKKTTL